MARLQRGRTHQPALFDPDLYLGSFVMLYVFAWPDDVHDEYAGLIKIGHSRNPARRHAFAFPETFFICALPGTEDEEAEIHDRLRPWAATHIPTNRSGYTEIYLPVGPVCAVVSDLYERSQRWLQDERTGA